MELSEIVRELEKDVDTFPQEALEAEFAGDGEPEFPPEIKGLIEDAIAAMEWWAWTDE